MAGDVTITERFVLFWGGWPSQWYRSGFAVGGVGYNCCEQYMMAEKARVFGDGEMLGRDDPRAQEPGQWLGSNWLGIALMRVRETIRAKDEGRDPVLDGELLAQLAERKGLPGA